ncbi:hypothetical protein [Coralloluteibacterium stylophorae]|uniref:Uncharacterized protein n=1 Tax=Coralloluteibacterium stylophorae TaxID=1776034 RepID=A0A8J7VT14_9GAMM|nr:hypothetical protein [Coralloluteibacterium stylophorae]MBS7457716.1 hypothetical protein [Coralloluteibacterium stylophorae]
MNESVVIAALVQVARAAHLLCDNTEDDGSDLRVERNDFSVLSGALDVLDALPDDRPGYVMGPAAKAEWALRRLKGSA